MHGLPVMLSGRPSFFNQLLLTMAAVNHTILIEDHNCTKPQHKILYGTLPQSTHADTKTTICKGIGQKRATVPYHCSFCPITFNAFSMP